MRIPPAKSRRKFSCLMRRKHSKNTLWDKKRFKSSRINSLKNLQKKPSCSVAVTLITLEQKIRCRYVLEHHQHNQAPQEFLANHLVPNANMLWNCKQLLTKKIEKSNTLVSLNNKKNKFRCFNIGFMFFLKLP